MYSDMNKMIIAIGVVAIVGIGIFTLSGSRGAEVLSAARFVNTYQETAGAVLLDVRTPEEFASGHLEGAINIDFQSPTFNSEIEKLDRTKQYFVYCRSGSRSAQAVAHMQELGFQNTVQLKGGIISNQSALALVTAAATASSEYVVDASDMLNSNALIDGIAKSELNEKEVQGLLLMREEEKLARDVYTTLGAQWGAQIFSNIARSEQTHADAVKALLDRYALADPVHDDTVGVFQSSAMQKQYDDLTAKGKVSLPDALAVGATIEDLDIRDLDMLMKETNQEDILVTYTNLQRGSRNHMRAFVKNLSALGVSYAPQYISPDVYASIVNAAQERGENKYTNTN